MTELAFKLIVSVILTLVIKYGVEVFDHWIAWWLAALISLVIVFGGWLIISNVDGAWE